jgi:hypothetical protein
MVIGFLRQAQRKFIPLLLYIFLYSLVILVWLIRVERYLIPLYAFILFFMLSGIRVVVDMVRKGRGMTAAALLASVLFSFHLFQAAPLLAKHAPVPGIDVGPHFRFVPVDQERWDMLQLQNWAGNNLPPHARFRVCHPEDFFILTGRPSGNIPVFSDVNDLDNLIRNKVDFIFYGKGNPECRDYLRHLLASQPYLFEKIQEIPGTDTALYRFYWQKAEKQDHPPIHP